MKAMRTVHIDTEKTWRGGEQQALYLVQGLRARGHVADVVCQPDSAIAERAGAAGAGIHPVRMRGDVDPLGVAGIASVLRAGGYDLVHMHTSRAHMLGCVAARLAGRTRTVVSRRVDFSSRQKGSRLSGFKYRFGVDVYIAISQAVRDVLATEGVRPDRIRIMHSGIDPKRLRVTGNDIRAELGIPADAPVVGCVAHLAAHKGHAHLVAALPRLLEARPSLRLLLVGDGELRDGLERQVADLGVGERVVFAGFRHDVPDCFMAMDVVAMPSVLEGLNTSLLDALCLERPVVACDAGGMPEIVHDGRTGLLAPPRDPDGLAKALLRMLDDRAAAGRMARDGRARVLREFTADAMVEGTLRVYRWLLDRKGGQAA
jgi:glycosyltransferase involved in cell wall biosynthesis